MDKQNEVYLYNRILFSHFGMSTDTAITWMNLENMLTEISQSQRTTYRFYDSTHNKWPEEANPQGQKEKQEFPMAEGKGNMS